MNRQEIIRMAKEAGLDLDGDNIFSPKSDPQVDVHIADLEAFAALVASAEREACAELCEMLDVANPKGKSWDEGTIDCAKAIRARGQA
jgi:hypothetical protein